jgi:hypothetical protein
VTFVVALFVPFGDVHHCADEPERAAILADDPKRVADPPRATVGNQDAILDSILGAFFDRSDAGRENTGAVVGVNPVEPDESARVRIIFPNDSAEAVE